MHSTVRCSARTSSILTALFIIALFIIPIIHYHYYTKLLYGEVKEEKKRKTEFEMLIN